MAAAAICRGGFGACGSIFGIVVQEASETSLGGNVAGPVLAGVLMAAAGGGWMEQLKEVPLPELPADAPTTAEAAGMFDRMVTALEAGDPLALDDLLYSGFPHPPLTTVPPVAPDIIRQLKACRVVRPLDFWRGERIVYFLSCEAAGERLETFFILKRDYDGKWRILR